MFTASTSVAAEGPDSFDFVGVIGFGKAFDDAVSVKSDKSDDVDMGTEAALLHKVSDKVAGAGRLHVPFPFPLSFLIVHPSVDEGFLDCYRHRGGCSPKLSSSSISFFSLFLF